VIELKEEVEKVKGTAGKTNQQLSKEHDMKVKETQQQAQVHKAAADKLKRENAELKKANEEGGGKIVIKEVEIIKEVLVGGPVDAAKAAKNAENEK